MADGSGGFHQLMLGINPGLVVDLFAGGGGASEGLENAFGHPVHVAINHNPLALAVHEVNHPDTKHYISDVFEVCPRMATAGLPVSHLHASPDCTHHSQARASQPRSAKVRALAWVVLKWAGRARPTSISLENVFQMRHWSALIAKRCPETGRVVKIDGTVAAKGERVPVQDQFLVPCPKRRGQTWRRFCKLLGELGYVFDSRVLSACDYGAPTTRERLYGFGRRDGRPIVWPEATHGDPNSEAVRSGKLLPWRTAADCIDFDRPCPSIFMATEDARKLRIKRPLADPSLRRIARGTLRYVIESADPFIVPLRGTSPSHTSVHAVHAPLSAISAGGTHHGLVVPTLVQVGYGERKGQAPRSLDINSPVGVIVAGGRKHAVANVELQAAHIVKFRGSSLGTAADIPMPTVTSGAGAARPAGAAHALGVVQAQLSPMPVRAMHLEQANTGMVGHDMRKPVSTITSTGSQQRLIATELEVEVWDARASAVYRLLRDYLPPKDFASIAANVEVDPTNPDHGRVFIYKDGVKLVLTDVGMRMLTPRELARAQGFPEDYVLEYDSKGKVVPQHSQVALIGNSVCKDVLEAIIRANCGDLIETYRQSGVQSRPGRKSLDQLAA